MASGVGRPVAEDWTIPTATTNLCDPSNRDTLEALVTAPDPTVAAITPTCWTVDPTYRCNMNCAGCIEASIRSRTGPREIPWAMLESLLHVGHKRGVRAVALFGGEPLCYRAIGEFLRTCAGLGIRIGMATNGTLIPAKRDEIVEHRDAFSYFRVSLNAGTERTHSAIFGPNRPVFERLLRSAKALAQGHVPVVISYVVSRENAAEISRCYDRVRYWAKGLELKPFVDPTSKYPVSLGPDVRGLVREQIEAIARKCDGQQADLRVAETMRTVLSTHSPEELHETKDYSFCPASLLREVVTPTGVVCCPYFRPDHRFCTGTLKDALCPNWLNNQARTQALRAVNPRRDCKFPCNRHALNAWVWQLRQRYQRGEDTVLEAIPRAQLDAAYWF